MFEPALNTVPQPTDDPSPSQREPAGATPTEKSRSGGIPLVDLSKTTLNSKEAQKVLEDLRQLCQNKDAQVAELEAAAKALRDSGYKIELFQALREAVEQPGAHPHVGAMWMHRIVSSNSWSRRYVQDMDALCEHGEVGYRAVIQFLEAAGAKRKKELVLEALRKHGKWLRDHPVGKIAAARALLNVRCYGKAARWMAGWPTGAEADPQILYCQVLGLRGTGRERQAHELVQLALAQPGVPEQFPAFKLWFALEEALAGNTPVATTRFKELQPAGWDDDLLALYYLVRGVLRVQRADPADQKDAFISGYYRVKDLFHKWPVYKQEMNLRRQHRRCVWRMAQDAKMWPQGLRALWESADSPVFLFPLLLVPGLQLFLPAYLVRLCTHRHGKGR